MVLYYIYKTEGSINYLTLINQLKLINGLNQIVSFDKVLCITVMHWNNQFVKVKNYEGCLVG